ncbi:GNAT family N-acetyltransferase [Glycomyces sp. NPDC047010]|uniref:GNAT family N-acetyltransferase n=1 Tax=Glycomyces sp. NPDC047010 TaxID=3155023 RepID=UPI0033D2BB04
MAQIDIRRADRPGDLGWIVQSQGVYYAEALGWDAGYEAMVAKIVSGFADLDPAREAVWIADVDGERAGSVALVDDGAPGTARLRILYVDPSARGLGLGSRLVGECLGFARDAGYERVVLWTVNVLDSARRIYQAAGFALGKEESFRRFGHDLTGQDWELELKPQ